MSFDILSPRQTVNHVWTETKSRLSVMRAHQLLSKRLIYLISDEWCLLPYEGSKVRIPMFGYMKTFDVLERTLDTRDSNLIPASVSYQF